MRMTELEAAIYSCAALQCFLVISVLWLKPFIGLEPPTEANSEEAVKNGNTFLSTQFSTSCKKHQIRLVNIYHTRGP